MDNGAEYYARFLEGDEAAFDELLKTYRDSLTFFINRYIHDLNASEDIAIDVFVHLIVKPHHYNFKISFKTYLFMIGRSKALDYLKAQKRIKLSDPKELEEQFSDSAEDTLLIHERKKVIAEALEKLPVDMQIALYLFYFEDMSYEEIAKIMKKNRKQIDNLLYRAKNELHYLIGKEGEDLL